MKKIYLYLLILLFIAVGNANAQVFYYSQGKKHQLQKDSSTLFLNVDKAKSKESFLPTLLGIEGIKSFDTTLDKSIIVLRLNSNANKTKIFALLKKDSRIFHAWEALTLDGTPFVATGEILLKPKKGQAINSILKSLNLEDKVLMSDSVYYDTYVLNVINTNNLFDIANSIYESKLVDWCHPNFFVSITNYQNDPLYGQQYYLRNTGQLGGVPGIDINVESAWNISRGGQNIRIAVIDEGVEDHEDLAGRVLNGFTPRDVNGNGRPTPTGAHGEATAGIIAATQDNFLGITGIAPQCQVVPINIFAGGETALDIANGINWAWNQGQADVLSNSWGYNTTSQTQPDFDAIIQAINNARTQGRGRRGSPVIFASGNNFGVINDVAFPANVNGVITVGACNNAAPAGNIWYYSERGSSMDLVAPSGDVNLNGDVVTLDRMGAFGYEPGNYTSRFGGTSAACPQVSGVAALMLSINSSLTETQVTNILQTTATDMGDAGFDNTFGYGRVNACAAVRQALTTSTISGDNIFCNTSNNYTIPNLSPTVTIQWQATPAGIVTVNSPNSSQTTLTINTNGTITLTAVISNACGQQITVSKPDIFVGTIPVDAISITLPFADPNNLECNTIYQAKGFAPSTYQPTAYRWTINPEWAIITNPANASINFAPNANASANGYLGLSVQNACGWSAEQVLFMQVNCAGGYSMKLSPNPASSSLTIETTDNNKFTKLRIIDKMGQVRKQLNYAASKKITINVSDLPPDVYRIQALVNNNWITLSFIKQ